MTDAVQEQIRQRDLVPTIATIARGLGWKVIELHGNKTNPGQTSLPDLMLTRDEERRMVKALSQKTELSAAQRKNFAHFTVAGFTCVVYRPGDFVQITDDLKP